MKILQGAMLAGLLGGVLAAPPAAAQGWPVALINNSAEDGTASPDGMTAVTIPGWTVTGSLTVVAYGTPGEFPPTGEHMTGQLFVGGPGSGLASASQTALIPEDAWGCIDVGGFCYVHVMAVLGGWEAEEDSARLVVTVLDGQSAELLRFVVGPVTAADRGQVTKFMTYTRGVAMPVGGRAVKVQLEMYGVDGSYRNAFADDIVVSIVYPDPALPSTWGGIKAGEWKAW
jgi:hypothetical protein